MKKKRFKIPHKEVAMSLSDKILIIISSSLTLVVVGVVLFAGFDVEQILLVGGSIYTLGFFLTFGVSRSFSRRMLDLTRQIEEMAAGNLSTRLQVNSRDEIGQLARAVNDLTKKLETGVAVDVSRHKEISRAKTDFVNIASHQLRTPLSIIKWYLDYLISGDAGEINDEQKKYLTEAYRGNERLIELVNGLLDVSRIDLGTFSIEPEPVDIAEIVDRACEKFSNLIIKNRLTIKKEIEKMPKINLDPRLTEISFEHIISNSIKYTPVGGTIKIRIKKEKENALFEITDTGCGIPEEQQPKIFTKLFRAENAKKMESVGTGLGLYIVKAVIEKAGGKIWFKSPSPELLLEENEDGNLDKKCKLRGTSFYLSIPLKGMKGKSGTKKLTSFK
jgi:signal transduction histidine kinase